MLFLQRLEISLVTQLNVLYTISEGHSGLTLGDNMNKRSWKKDSLTPHVASFPETYHVCPCCGSEHLSTLAWTTNNGKEILDPVDGDNNPPGIGPMIACFDCETFNIHPILDGDQ